MKKLDLKYKLTYQEAYDAFYVLASRRSRRVKVLTGGLLTVIAVIMLIMYAVNGNGLNYFFLAIVSAALLFYIIYAPVISARRGARSVAAADGLYHIVLHADATIVFPREKAIPIAGDKFARTVETDMVFAIRPDSGHTICIPKRVLTEREAAFVREITNAAKI